MTVHWLDWPAPSNVKACFTARDGGESLAPFSSFNLGLHVGDDESLVIKNRQILSNSIEQKNIHWLDQIHSTQVVNLDRTYHSQADASVSTKVGQVCSVMTADCLPVFVCDEQGTQVAAAHAGWRGLCHGVLQNTVNAMNNKSSLLAYLGPAISQSAFEVGDEVRLAFKHHYPQLGTDKHFVHHGVEGKWMGDLYGLARDILSDLSVQNVYGGDRCTFSEQEIFFSFRRDKTTGRMANLIWLE